MNARIPAPLPAPEDTLRARFEASRRLIRSLSRFWTEPGDMMIQRLDALEQRAIAKIREISRHA